MAKGLRGSVIGLDVTERARLNYLISELSLVQSQVEHLGREVMKFLIDINTRKETGGGTSNGKHDTATKS